MAGGSGVIGCQMFGADDTPALSTEHLSRLVCGKRIVDDVSVSLGRGEVIAVVGPSGSGKTSFLRLLNRLDEPTEGDVFLGGVSYREVPPPDLRRKVGMVMQRPFLSPGTVGDNVRFGPAQRRETVQQGRVEEILGRVGLTGYAERPAGDLSGGEAQRVSLARTLINSPEILLLDEPTSALDEHSREKVERLISHLLSELNLACLFVTHDLKQASRVANRIMVMKEGRLVRVGLVEDILGA